MNVDYNPFEGLRVRGKPRKVFLRGNLIVDEDRFLGSAGMGSFLRAERFFPKNA